MDWIVAINRHRDALLRMLATLFVLAGGGVDMPRRVRTRIWRVLRPAEAAFRRLVVVECARMAYKVPVAAPRGAPVGLVRKPRDSAKRVPCFALFDPRKRFGIKRRTHRVGIGPRVWSPGMDDPVFDTWTPPLPDDVVSAAHLRRRMEALQAALHDLPKQARRLAR